MKGLEEVLKILDEWLKCLNLDGVSGDDNFGKARGIITPYKRFRSLMIKKFKTMKKAFAFYDFHTNGSLSY